MAYSNIKQPTLYFNTKLYTGNGTTATGITGVGFQPDMTWIKERSQIRSHVLFDVIRGATVQLNTNDTAVDATVAESLQSFDSDGFTVGNATSVNQSGETYVGWNWLASNTTASNTDGSITSTVSANTTSGFSIVSYTANGVSGSTVGHGLGVAPAMIFVKNRSGANDWNGLHQSLTGTNGIFLNLTAATVASSTFWNNTNPTSSVFTIGNHVTVNTNTNNYIAYCFAEKKGFSKFGKYTGNGSTDGTFVYTGFKPAFVMVKRTDSTADWHIQDNKRNTFNEVDTSLFANTTDVDTQSATYDTDFLSNGFKLRGTTTARNGSGATYIYMAFADEPLVGDNPATAR
jgi:hypothetical protein